MGSGDSGSWGFSGGGLGDVGLRVEDLRVKSLKGAGLGLGIGFLSRHPVVLGKSSGFSRRNVPTATRPLLSLADQAYKKVSPSKQRSRSSEQGANTPSIQQARGGGHERARPCKAAGTLAKGHP